MALRISTTSSVRPYYSKGLRARYLTDGIRAEQAQAEAEMGSKYADIGYEVDEAKFLARTYRRASAGGLPTTVPAGWPEQLQGPLVWGPESFPDENEYVYMLTEQDQTEIIHALHSFKVRKLDPSSVTKDLFPLPTLGPRLSSIANDIYLGRGFSIIRGLDPDAFELSDLTTIYLGITSYIAPTRGKQDQRGSMLIHVMKRGDDASPDAFDDEYGSSKPFHTDCVTDTLCLFAQQLAASGGSSVIASAYSVYNYLAATRPDIIHTLATPNWPFDTYGRDPAFYRRALMYFHDGKLITSFSRRLLVGYPFAPRTEGIPGLTEAQAEALDAVHFAAKKLEIMPRMERGDIRLVNNMGLLHRREAFENPKGVDAAKGRHLVRLWLHNEELCWTLPEPLRLAWARVFEDDDEERREHWDLAPVRNPATGRVLRVGGSCD